ncbi:MAG: biotin--protein ligase [Firmicutes bacterium HGW-Firmicutes-12]|jgi:lipoate-protein ligase A|nr:MAG: biotin--protein ligase [Firmicutes bacterium HGW-Firmicutes-12]
MNLYRLGKLPGFDAMTVFHAMAYLGVEGLVFVSPSDPIVTLGYFQDAKTGVDLDYCQRANLGVMRREVGGGTTLLDSNQIFFQIILHKDNEIARGDALDLYRKFSEPVIKAYGDLGVKVRFKEVNDLITVEGNKKITGEGGANIGESKVFVGGILLDFDTETMSKVFPVPNEEYRQQILQTLENNVTSLKKELGQIPSREFVENRLIHHFSELFGPLEEGSLNTEVLNKARELEKLYTSEEFISRKRKENTSIKIASGIHVYENRYKAVGGTIHSIIELKEKKLGKVNLYGDFTFLPKEKVRDLEEALVDVEMEKEQIKQVITLFIQKEKIDTPGVTPEDFATAIVGTNI